MFLVVDAEGAFFGGPSSAFGGHEFPDAIVPYELQVFELAHAVTRPIPVIEVPQPVAGELRAVATKLAPAFAADPQTAMYPGLGLVQPGVVAAVAGILFPQECFADAAVHPARGDQILGDSVMHRS